MKVKIYVNGLDDNLSMTKSLRKWLENTDTSDISVTQNRSQLKQDEAGGLFEAILTIVLAAPTTVILAKSIHVWMQEKTKRLSSKTKELKITLENEKGQKITIESKNLELGEHLFISKITEHFQKE